MSPSDDFIAFQTALAGEYSRQRELGRGGMGVVYLARDVQLDRDVAIKTIPSELASADARGRFLREARTAAGLSHPHIVPIHRVGEVGGFVFFVMSYVDGESLGDRLRARGPLPAADAARVLREVAWALAYAHGRGIVHRDIKPDNILLEAGTGRALVTDFGIAHVRTDFSSNISSDISALTDPHVIIGTAHFMSPEQASNEPLDGRSDIYALGVVGYLAVSGKLPFEASSVPMFIAKQATESPMSVLRAAPGLPAALAATIDRCLQRDPTMRFANGEALATALAPTTSARSTLSPPLRAWLGARNPLIVPYLGWSGIFGTASLANFAVWITGNRPDGPADIAHREHAEADALARRDDVQPIHRMLRAATVFSATWLAGTFGLVVQGTLHENKNGAAFFIAPLLTTMLLGALSNALDVGFIPRKVRGWWQTGVRERL